MDPRLRPLAADLVYDARLRDGRPAVVYVLFEHKSRPERLGRISKLGDPRSCSRFGHSIARLGPPARGHSAGETPAVPGEDAPRDGRVPQLRDAPERLVAFQLLRYEEDVRADRPLRPIIPVVVYHSQPRWRVPVTFGALFDGPEALRRYWPEYRYEITDVSHLPPDEVRGAVATQIALRILRSILLPHLREELRRIVSSLWAPNDPSWAQGIFALAMHYVIEAPNDIDRAELGRIMAEAPPKAREVAMTATVTDSATPRWD